MDITDINLIHQQYSKCLQQERLKTKELDQILLEKSKLKQRSFDFNSSLDQSEADCMSLLSIFDKTWNLAQPIASKVESLDQEHGRINGCIELLRSIKQLQVFCINLGMRQWSPVGHISKQHLVRLRIHSNILGCEPGHYSRFICPN
jgi:hypothetical protein